MKLEGYYSSGQFAKMAGVSIRTIRFYDNQNILKPSYVNESGARFYTDSDFAKLQQILLFKYLGFSLDDIKEMSIDTIDYHFMLNALKLQKKLVEDKLEQMQLVAQAIDGTVELIEKEHQLDWSNMLELIHLTGMEKSLKSQYQNAGNISARIRLHRDYSTNKQGWFPWVYEQCNIEPGMRILEIGCGNGALWSENSDRLVDNVEVWLTDVSEGMVRDARRSIADARGIFSFDICDCHELPYEDASFDMVIANHVLFYCEDVTKVCNEVKRVLKQGGKFICSTYGSEHMKEITGLVQAFDARIVLAARNLSDIFGLENGEDILRNAFEEIECHRYEDAIIIDKSEPLIDYILSCHGNQNQYLLEKYKEFKAFVEKKMLYGFKITKDAGIFIAKKGKN
ncbi:MAG: methyltransferase domain-containing protein [Lachnospiraceae bacterium]|nr:methyltransferase domain-containing protein [Lachnospiraceae bacterium]